MLARAAERGLPDADRLFDLTPREISWRLRAHATRRAESDELAWMIARYVALAVHAPEKLPNRPSICANDADMTDQDMKARLLAWARKEGGIT